MARRAVEEVGIDSAYKNLAASIVEQAVDEYVDCLRRVRFGLGMGSHPNWQTFRSMNELERFFLSDWFLLLCGFDGAHVINVLQDNNLDRRSKDYILARRKLLHFF